MLIAIPRQEAPQRRRGRREVKENDIAVEGLLPIHEAQMLTYLKLGGWSVGLLINFNVPALRRGIKRIVHDFKEISAPSAPLR